MKQDWERYWDQYGFPDNFMKSAIEPFGNPVRVLIAQEAELGKSVLDVGCASCISHPLFQGKKEYVGVDFTLNFLKVAKKDHPGVDVVCGTAWELPFRDGAFDVSYVKDVLEHTGPEAYKKILDEMWRISRMKIVIAFFGNVYGLTEYKMGREPEGGVYYFNKYGEDFLEYVSKLPGIADFRIIRDVALENAGNAKSRTVVIAGKNPVGKII